MWCLLRYLICFTTCWFVQANAQGSVSSFRQAASMPPVLSVQLSRPSHTRWMCRELHGLAKIARAERILPQFCVLTPCGPLPELPPHLLCQDRRVPEDLLHGQSIMTDRLQLTGLSNDFLIFVVFLSCSLCYITQRGRHNSLNISVHLLEALEDVLVERNSAFSCSSFLYPCPKNIYLFSPLIVGSWRGSVLYHDFLNAPV